MIASAKNYIKTQNKQTKNTRQNPGQMVKTKLYRQNHTKKAYRYTLRKREKGKNIYISIYKKKIGREQPNQ